jgi:ribonuclease J
MLYYYTEEDNIMEIKTYGANKIGGCVTEIQSRDTKIIFDYGNNLDDTPQLDIEGLTYGKPSYEAVFISHYHLDHIGAIDKILNDITIYVEETTKKLYDIICDFQSKPKVKIKTFNFNKDIILKNNIRVTAYKVDHSAYNSAMFLIADGKEKALYTGDFRNNGYTGNNLIPTFKAIGKIDYLITEGTDIGDNSHIIRKEKSLVKEFSTIMRKYNQVFVLMSASNIDRITTILKASNQTNHILIEDIYMVHLAATIFREDNINIPNPISFNNVMVYKPRYFNQKDDDFKSKYLNCFNNKNNSKMLYQPFTMNVRTSMLNDLKMFKRKHILTNACLIYSMWSGYKQKDDIKKFLYDIKKLGITLIEKEYHTTGHASKELINKVIEITNPTKIYIIHTTSKWKGEKLI